MDPAQVAFLAVAGLTLGLSLLKFGNPVILDEMVSKPRDAAEFVLGPWPAAWGYFLTGLTALLGLWAVRWKWERKYWPLALPVFWLIWQFLSSFQTESRPLTASVLPQFTACAVWFALGLAVLSRTAVLRPLWWGLIFCYAVMLWQGFGQHYGGLEATRAYVYEQPNWQSLPETYLKKIASDRIFATLVYPNALAGVILLYFPMLTCALVRATARWHRLARLVTVGLFIYMNAACFYWTGSKAGWLIALALGALALLHLPMPQRRRIALAALLVAGGLAGFAFQFKEYFQRGAPSASARFHYWRAAWTTAIDQPFLGTGPGAFSVAYARIKPPEAEMARLTHNDYLQQASDSGWIGCAAYTAWVMTGLALLYRRTRKTLTDFRFLVWLGLMGWALQSFVEFGLYIPALAWPAFFWLGWGVVAHESALKGGETLKIPQYAL